MAAASTRGNALKAARLASGATMQDVADVLGVAVNTISKRESKPEDVRLSDLKAWYRVCDENGKWILDKWLDVFLGK